MMSEPKFKVGDEAFSMMYGKIGKIVGITRGPVKLFFIDFGQKEVEGDNTFTVDEGDLKHLHELSVADNTNNANNVNEFIDFVCNKLDEVKELFRRKNQQYSVGADPLANFRAGALLRAGNDSYAEMYEEAKNYRRKHVVHIERNGIDGDKVDESLADIIIYSAIMLYMHAHRQEDLKQ